MSPSRNFQALARRRIDLRPTCSAARASSIGFHGAPRPAERRSAMNGHLRIATSCLRAMVVFCLGPVGLLAQGSAGWWTLDELSGTVAFDSSGNGNHGSFSGTTTVPAVRNHGRRFSGSDVIVVS